MEVLKIEEIKKENVDPDVKSSFWSYLKHKEINYLPSTSLRWWLLIILVFVWTVEQFERAKMGPVLVFLMEDFNVSLQMWGIISAIGTAISIISTYIASNLADNFGRKPLIVWPLFIYIFIAIGTAMAPNFMTVASLHIFGAFVVAAMYPVIQAAVSDNSPRMGRAFAYSWLSLAFILGSLSSNWAGALIIPVWPGWRPQFWVAAGIALITFLIAWLLYRDISEKIRGKITKDKTESKKSVALDESKVNIGDRQSGNLVYKDWRIWILSIVLFLWVIFYVTAVGYMPLYFTQYFGIEPANSASLANVFWIVFVFSVFLSGWLSDRLQMRKVIILFGGLTTGIMLLILASLTPNASVTSIAFILGATGFFSGFIYPAWCAMLSENAEAISAFGIARAFGIAAILQAVGSCLMHFGLPAVVGNWGWTAWILICGIACILIAICSCFGKEVHGRHKAKALI